MHKKFEVNRKKISGGCQSERKAAEMISYSKMPLVYMVYDLQETVENAN